ncbi:SDR family oxidoreductase [Salisaeta longa]|uniref:SDR family oxidoreductase n=1 Tax=Salisaeta longa TaxID=503170 RepID=UPI0003B420A2|nr:SDR family NAD(P)-dependent oxidoreductase [Salisaeta longa]
MNIQDKVAVVTGASSGIGRVISTQLVEGGATVFGLARSGDTLSAVRDELGDAFHPVTCDVRDAASVAEAFAVVEDSAGRCDVLVNNAGYGEFGGIEDLTPEAFDQQQATNVNGVFLCTQQAVPMMRAQNEAEGFGGHIVNIASIAGLLGNPNISAYNASKFAVRGFSDAMMKELRDDGIKVTCVYPGSVETNFSDVAGSSIAPNPMQPEDVAGTVLHVIEGPDNYLISEVVMRPLRPRG